jgi:cytochrome b561
MASKHSITMHWGVLLIVYLAILFATTMVMLTSGPANNYFALLLAVGVPIYFIASRALMTEDESASSAATDLPGSVAESNVVAFPERPAAIPTDMNNLRKLG